MASGLTRYQERTLSALYETIVARMRNMELVTEHIDVEMTQFLYTPGPSFSQVENLMHNHFTVSDDRMIEALTLQQSTAQDEPLPAATLWEEDEYTPAIAETWAEQLTAHPNSPLFVRYVGMCAAPITPFDRMRDDGLYRQHGVYHHFVRALAQIDEETLDAGRAYFFVNRILPPGTENQLIDDTERIIISFFQLGKLLNQQAGGYYVSYQPNPRYIGLCRELNIRYFQLREQGRIWAENDPRLDGWLDNLRREMERRPFPQETLNVIRTQARPCEFGGHNLLMLVGKDITVEDFQGSRSFLSGNSRAGYLTADFLSRIEAYSRGDTTWRTTDFRSDIFPFIDLFPWPAPLDDHTAALNQLTAYLQSVRPVVLATFSHMVASYANANFYHGYGISKVDFLDSVGEPSMHTYAPREWLEDDSQQETPRGYSSIVIPHIDPGRDKYGPYQVELKVVIDLTWMATLTIASIAMSVIDEVMERNHDDICEEVLRRFRELRGTRDHPVCRLWMTLEAAKNDLHTFWVQERERQCHNTTIARVDTELRRRNARNQMLAGGIALGRPNSPARASQVNYLWKLKLPDLFLHIQPTEEEAWRGWASNLAEGTFYFASSLNRAARLIRGRHSLYNVLQQFRPEDATDDSWMYNEEQRQAALEAKGRQLRGGLAPDFFSPENQRRRALARPVTIEYTPVIENREIHMQQGDRFVIHWLDGEGLINIRLRIPALTLPNISDTWRVRFLPDGIGIYGDHYGRVRPRGDGDRQAVFSLQYLHTHARSADLISMWREERSRIEGVSATRPLISLPGRRPLSRHDNPTQARQSGNWWPVDQSDALWLLERYLSQNYPENGYFIIASAEIMEKVRRSPRNRDHNSDDFVAGFNTFLLQYPDHPYSPLWQEWMSDLRSYNAGTLVNIQFLRHDFEKKAVKIRVPAGMRQYQQVTIGRPFQGP
ncbi:hypothetical protein EC973_006325 [Apophysomyces ossiformis]|uniref:Uncharacterized protein n=1 Tax=Apophysomyces ossiformis TaxID=679940 RepID=A0A8H7EKQ7_9FUNG|nr:hypothetical protein EC973_006325 [Apophysomyces ossiformis]